MLNGAPPLVLASASPRRREILAGLGLKFEVAPVEGITERQMGADFTGHARELAYHIAMKKASIASSWHGSSVVVAADTTVVVDQTLLGKPRDVPEATRYLQMLQGRSHEVITGVAIFDGATGNIVGGEELTRVRFAPMTDAEIAQYVASGEPFDKAGGYAIQGIGSLFITGIEGDYFNVVGFPVYRFRQLLRRLRYNLEQWVLHSPATEVHVGAEPEDDRSLLAAE